MRKASIFIIFATLLVLSILASSASALVISSVDSDTIAPGQEGKMTIIIKNNENSDIGDVVLSLDFTNLPLSSSGSSSETIEEIQEDDKESVAFLIRADVNAETGDYKIPYTISYDGSSIVQKGTFSVRVSASPDIGFSSFVQNSVIGQKGKVSLKIINSGLGEAKFIKIQISPEGYTLLSEEQQYISSIDSNDFDSISLDVIFKNKNAYLSGIISYKDENNKQYTKPFSIPLNVYTQDEAIKQGIIAKNNTFMYILVILVIVVAWFIWRAYRKRARLRKSREAMANTGR